MKESRDIIIRPIISEEALRNQEDFNKYTFEVDKKANKVEIRNAIEDIFGVKVKEVNTMNYKGKVKRNGRHLTKKKNWKKAIVTLTDDSPSIEIYDT